MINLWGRFKETWFLPLFGCQKLERIIHIYLFFTSNMTREDRRNFIKNIFRLAIGVVLLVACFWYLKHHPAEQIALYSGLKTIIQKGEVLAYNVLWRDGNQLARKYELENRYLELIHRAEEKGCKDTELVEALHQTYETFLQEDKKKISYYIAKYMILFSEYDSSVEECS